MLRYRGAVEGLEGRLRGGRSLAPGSLAHVKTLTEMDCRYKLYGAYMGRVYFFNLSAKYEGDGSISRPFRTFRLIPDRVTMFVKGKSGNTN